jgi:hypothetical protein
MSRNPWTDPDPQPGDLDAELDQLDESAVEYHKGDPSASFGLMVVVEDEDASRLARIAEARGLKPSEVLAELLRDADRPAAYAARRAPGALVRGDGRRARQAKQAARSRSRRRSRRRAGFRLEEPAGARSSEVGAFATLAGRSLTSPRA